MDIQELAIQYAQAWGERDPDAIIALHTEDTVFHIHGEGAEPAVGREAARALVAEQFVASPDLSMQPTRVHFGEDHFVAEFTMSGTREGKEFSCDGVDVLSVKDGLVARKDSYADWALYMRQVGMELGAPVSA
jgi:steroid delta-isomerase-like uncharacterized protein